LYKNANPEDKRFIDALSAAGPDGFIGGSESDEDRRRAEKAERDRIDAHPKNTFNFSDMATAGDAASAGTQSGSGFRQGLKNELDQAVEDVANAVGQMKGLLNFNASPTITPKVNTPSGGLERHSSISNVSRRLARRIDDRTIGNFADTEYG